MVTVPPGVAAALDQYHALLLQLVAFLVVLGGAYLLGRLLLVPPLVRVIRLRNPENPTLVDAVSLYARVIIFVFALGLATIAGGFGSVLQGSALVIAAATLALGVAGQDVIGNLVSGVFLVVDPDFSIGDYIEWKDQSGRIEQIDFRVTRVRTSAGETVTVPNSQLTTNALKAPYHGERYRLSDTFGVRYEDDVGEAIRITEAAAAADDRVLGDPAPAVQATGFGGSSVNLVARYWVAEPEGTPIGDVRTEFIERATTELAAADITVNPPSQQELSGSVSIGDADSP